MGKKRGFPPPKESGEYGRFKDLPRRLVAVPVAEVHEKRKEFRTAPYSICLAHSGLVMMDDMGTHADGLLRC